MFRFILLAAFFVVPSFAIADVKVTMSNGDIISGELLSSAQGADDVVIKTAFIGKVTLPRAQITTISDGDEVLFPPHVPQLYETSDAVFNPKAYKLSGNIDVGVSVDSGNSDEQEYLIDAKIKARNVKNRWTLVVDSDFNSKNGKEIENDHSIDLLYDRFAKGSKWFYGARGKAEVDKVTDLDIRTRLGPIVGYQMFDDDDLSLLFRVGPEWLHEEYENQDADDYVSAFWSLDYEQQLFKKVRGFHNHQITAPFSDVDAFLFESDTGLRIPLSEHLRATAGIEFDWSNSPPEGIREQDLTYYLKLGYEF